MQHLRIGLFVYVLFTPTLFFPVMVILIILYDLFFDSSILVLMSVYGQKHQLLNEVINGWKGSLPLSIFVSWFVYGPTYLALQRKFCTTNWLLPLSGFIICFTISLFAFNFNISGAFFYALTGLILATGLEIIQHFHAMNKTPA